MAAKTTTKGNTAKPKATDPLGTPVSARDAAEVVLLAEGKALHYREISRLALERGLVKVRGKRKPNLDRTTKTMRSYLAGCAAKGEKFVRIDPGVFDLKVRPKTKASAKAKAEPTK